MWDSKVTRTVVVTDPMGVHARTATAIAEVVRRGKSEVKLIRNQQAVSATDVLQILTMATHQGDTVTLEAVGEDAETVVGAIELLLAGRFGEET